MGVYPCEDGTCVVNGAVDHLPCLLGFKPNEKNAKTELNEGNLSIFN